MAGRATRGVTIFDTGDDQKVVSVELVSEPAEAEIGEAAEGTAK
jgi:DNA gyrase subunit A